MCTDYNISEQDKLHDVIFQIARWVNSNMILYNAFAINFLSLP
jgi:hypothetical protein